MAYQDANVTDAQRELINLRVSDELGQVGAHAVSDEVARRAGAENAAALYSAYSAYTRGEMTAEQSTQLEAYAEIRREQLSTPAEVTMLEADLQTRRGELQRESAEYQAKGRFSSSHALYELGKIVSLGQMRDPSERPAALEENLERREFTNDINRLIDVNGNENPDPGRIPAKTANRGGGNTPGGPL